MSIIDNCTDFMEDDPHLEIVAVVNVQAMAVILEHVKANFDDKRCCSVSLDHIAGQFHLECAANTARRLLKANRAKTGKFTSEVAYRLAASTNIQRVVEMNQANASSTSVAVVFADYMSDEERQKIVQFAAFASEHGECIPPNTIASRMDAPALAAMKKEFKLTDAEVKEFGLENCVVNKIAIKDL